jgi:hypothetical protein
MKAFFHKILSVALASLVFVTTMSFTVNMHYCGDSLVDFALFHNAQSCGMENQSSQKSCEAGFSEKSCCSDAQIVNDGQDDLKTSYTNLSFEHQAFVATFFYTYINLFDGLDKNFIPFKNYASPLLVTNIQVLNQVFLI